MQTKEILKKRRSIRNFLHKPIPPNIIKELIDCARFAPTAKNIQPWEFVVITKKEILEEIASLAENGRFIKDCYCCIAVFCRQTKYYLEDGCAATQNILLAAEDSGLASCWVAGDKKPYCAQVAELLAVPQEFKLVSLIPLGYTEAKRDSVAKRSLEEMIHWDKF